MEQSECEELDDKTLSTIQFFLSTNVLQEVLLYTFRMNEGEHIRGHISQFDNEDQTMLLLCSLPSSYKSFREILIYDRSNGFARSITKLGLPVYDGELVFASLFGELKFSS
ncbi:hypothetical protein Gogos_001890 [Gossypium gossypioides]|uniref:Uncharacterized protein n=1 Tax=Gossypium gossypioides TaxID=34282 RepID=A0A7J9CPP3_GOSGO|nr:hypothetical protein [Gossypium gossypioides]